MGKAELGETTFGVIGHPGEVIDASVLLNGTDKEESPDLFDEGCIGIQDQRDTRVLPVHAAEIGGSTDGTDRDAVRQEGCGRIFPAFGDGLDVGGVVWRPDDGQDPAGGEVFGGRFTTGAFDLVLTAELSVDGIGSGFG